MADPRKKKDDEEAGFGAGQSIYRGLSKASQKLNSFERGVQGTAAAALDQVTAPVRRQLTSAGNVGRGIASGFDSTIKPEAYKATPFQDNLERARPDVYGLPRNAAPAAAPAAATAPAAAIQRAAPMFITPAAGQIPDNQFARPAAPAGGPAPTTPPAGAAVPGSGAAASLGAGGGTFNGRQITAADAQALAAKLPTASGPVVMGPNGSYAASINAPAPAGSLTAAAQAPSQTPLQVPSFRLPSTDTTRVRAAEEERKALVSSLGDQIARMRISPNALNTRGKRDLYARLLGQQADLTGQAGSLAGSAAGQELDAATRTGIATQGEVGQNARAQLADTGATDRALLQEFGANQRNAATLSRPQYITDETGRQLAVTDALARPVTDATGNVIQAPTPNSGLTPAQVLDAYTAQLKNAQDSVDPDAALAELNQGPLGQLYASVIGGGAPATGGAPPAEAVAELKANPQTAAQFDETFGKGAAARYLK